MNPSILAIGSMVAVFLACIFGFCGINGAAYSFSAASFVLLVIFISVVKK